LKFKAILYRTKQTMRLVLELSKKDLEIRFLGSYLGLAWAFIQPTIQILLFWFVFQVGFKSAPVDNVPFILWLTAAMVPWLFVSDSLNNAANSVVDNRHLVKKMNFNAMILPLVKITNSLYIHTFFVIFLFLMYLVYDVIPDIFTLQVVYYSFSCICLVLGVSLITSALVVFIKDVGQAVSMSLQFLFWLTPIFWSLDIMPEKYHVWIKLNPLIYIVEGYRDAFIYKHWFWEHPFQSIYFWSVTITLIVVGATIFKRTKPHFADVL